MIIGDTKLGDKVRVFLDADGNICSYITSSTVVATVIGMDRRYFILGWKVYGAYAPADPRKGTLRSSGIQYSSDVDDYGWGAFVNRDYQCELETPLLFIKDAKLGDEIGLLISSPGVITDSRSEMDGILNATIIGIIRNSYHEVIVGWKTKEYKLAYKRTHAIRADATYILHQMDYVWGATLGSLIPIQRINSVGAAAITASLPKKIDAADWKFFQNNTSGECPCGGTRGICPYHK